MKKTPYKRSTPPSAVKSSAAGHVADTNTPKRGGSPSLLKIYENVIDIDSGDDDCVIERCVMRSRPYAGTTTEAEKTQTTKEEIPNPTPAKRLVSCCVFHGRTDFVRVTSQSPRVVATSLRPQNSQPYQCSKCFHLFQRFVDAARVHHCVIDAIDYPDTSTSALSCSFRQSPSQKQRFLSTKMPSQPSLKSFTGKPTISFDEFRVRVICKRSHRFLLTEAHLRANLWCPICALQQELGGSIGHRTPKEAMKAQESHSQWYQKKLFDEARRSFLDATKADCTFHEDRRAGPLPPSFNCPKACSSLPLGKRSRRGCQPGH